MLSFLKILPPKSGIRALKKNIFFQKNKRIFCKLVIALVCICSVFSLHGRLEAAESLSLLKVIERALSKSDKAMDLRDSLILSDMEVEAAEHLFDTEIVPLTSVGIIQGTGSQQLGMEFRKETEVGTSVAYGVVGNRIDDSTGYAVENQNNAKAYVKVSQGLFRRWGKKYNLTDLSAAELRDKEEEVRVERNRQSLILDAVNKYYDLVLASRLLNNVEQALERSQEHLRSASSKQDVGLVSKTDVYRAELAMLDAEATLEQQRRAKRRAADSLKELLLLSPEDNIDVDNSIVKMSPVIPEKWQETIFDTRLDWQAHRISMEVGEMEIYRAKQNLEPDLGLSFTVEQKGEGDSAEEALELDQTNWSVQLELYSTLDTFNEESNLTRRKIEMAKLRRAKEALKRKIKRESTDAFLDLVTEEKGHEIGLKRLEQAKMALDLAQTRYERGLSDNLEVIDAESAYSEAEINLARSLTGYNMAAVSLAYNLGVLDRQWLELSLSPGVASFSSSNLASKNEFK